MLARICVSMDAGSGRVGEGKQADGAAPLISSPPLLQPLPRLPACSSTASAASDAKDAGDEEGSKPGAVEVSLIAVGGAPSAAAPDLAQFEHASVLRLRHSLLSLDACAPLLGCASPVTGRSPSFQHLVKLDLSWNALEGRGLPSLAACVPNLRTLDVSGNGLQDLSIVLGCAQLQSLWAHSCAISSLPDAATVLRSLGGLRTAVLYDNPATLLPIMASAAAAATAAAAAAAAVANSPSATKAPLHLDQHDLALFLCAHAPHVQRWVVVRPASALSGGTAAPLPTPTTGTLLSGEGGAAAHVTAAHVAPAVATITPAFVAAAREWLASAAGETATRRLHRLAQVAQPPPAQWRAQLQMFTGVATKAKAVAGLVGGAHALRMGATLMPGASGSGSGSGSGSSSGSGVSVSGATSSFPSPSASRGVSLAAGKAGGARQSIASVDASAGTASARGSALAGKRATPEPAAARGAATKNGVLLKPPAGKDALHHTASAGRPPLASSSAAARVAPAAPASSDKSRLLSDGRSHAAPSSQPARGPGATAPTSTATDSMLAKGASIDAVSQLSTGSATARLPNEINAADAGLCTDGYRVTFSGRVLAHAVAAAPSAGSTDAASGASTVEGGPGEGLTGLNAVALRVWADGRAQGCWPDGSPSLLIAPDTSASAAVARYADIMQLLNSGSSASLQSFAQLVDEEAKAAEETEEGEAEEAASIASAVTSAPFCLTAYAREFEGRHMQRAGQSAIAAAQPVTQVVSVGESVSTHSLLSVASGASRLTGRYGSNQKPTVEVNGYGVGEVTGLSGQQLLVFFEDGGGLAAAPSGIPIVRWSSLGEVTYTNPDVEYTPPDVPPLGCLPVTDSGSDASVALTDDVLSLRHSVLSDAFEGFTIPPASQLTWRPQSPATPIVVYTPTCVGYIIGAHLAVLYNFVTHHAKLYMACHAFRYELMVASSTAANVQDEPPLPLPLTINEELSPVAEETGDGTVGGSRGRHAPGVPAAVAHFFVASTSRTSLTSAGSERSSAAPTPTLSSAAAALMLHNPAEGSLPDLFLGGGHPQDQLAAAAGEDGAAPPTAFIPDTPSTSHTSFSV